MRFKALVRFDPISTLCSRFDFFLRLSFFNIRALSRFFMRWLPYSPIVLKQLIASLYSLSLITKTPDIVSFIMESFLLFSQMCSSIFSNFNPKYIYGVSGSSKQQAIN